MAAAVYRRAALVPSATPPTQQRKRPSTRRGRAVVAHTHPRDLSTSASAPAADGSVVVDASAVVNEEQTSEAEVPRWKRRYKIVLSDVVAQRSREYWNREWNGRDLTYAAFIGGLHAVCLWAPSTFTPGHLGLAAALYVVTGMLGITLSYHRQLSHKSFTTPKWLEYALAYCGVLSMQGPPIEWVSAHRYHHQFCDTPKDPHSPHEGFWHSHVGWLLDNEVNDKRAGMRGNVGDMERQPFYQFIERTYIWHPVALGALILAVGGWPAFVWGVAVRAVWVYHITWAVNSLSHVWGNQAFDTGDESRNNALVGLLAFGEGFHNNHHAFEFSARHGLLPGQIDLTWWTVKALKALGLATNVRVPSAAQMDKMRAKPA